MLTEFCQILGGLHRRLDAEAAAELAGRAEGFFEVMKDVAELGGFFEIELLGGGGHFLAQGIKNLALALAV